MSTGRSEYRPVLIFPIIFGYHLYFTIGFLPDQKKALILKPRKSTTYGSTALVMLNTMLKSAPQIPVLMKISYGKIEGVKKFQKKISNIFFFIYIFYKNIYIFKNLLQRKFTIFRYSVQCIFK